MSNTPEHNDDWLRKLEEEQRKRQEELLARLTTFIRKNFTTTREEGPDTITMTTAEVYNRLQAIFPSNMYDYEVVAELMDKIGFLVVNKGNFNGEWLLKKKKKHGYNS